MHNYNLFKHNLSRKIKNHSYKQFDHEDHLNNFFNNFKKKTKYDLKTKKVEGCGMCNSSKDLIVHDKDKNDITCSDCFQKHGMSHKRYTKNRTKFYPIHESKDKNHKKIFNQHKINKFLEKYKDEHPLTNLDKFEESAKGLDKKFMKRMDKDYIMNQGGSTYKKNKTRLAYLIGLNEHSHKDAISPSLKANTHALLLQHLKHHNNPKPSFPNLKKLGTIQEIEEQLENNPGIAHRIFLE
jgi:hypothetical protein